MIRIETLLPSPVATSMPETSTSWGPANRASMPKADFDKTAANNPPLLGAASERLCKRALVDPLLPSVSVSFGEAR